MPPSPSPLDLYTQQIQQIEQDADAVLQGLHAHAQQMLMELQQQKLAFPADSPRRGQLDQWILALMGLFSHQQAQWTEHVAQTRNSLISNAKLVHSLDLAFPVAGSEQPLS